MKRRILNSTFATAHRRSRLVSFSHFAPRLARPNSPLAPARTLPPGTLWDPTLLDRLQLPLSRHRE